MPLLNHLLNGNSSKSSFISIFSLVFRMLCSMSLLDSNRRGPSLQLPRGVQCSSWLVFLLGHANIYVAVSCGAVVAGRPKRPPFLWVFSGITEPYHPSLQHFPPSPRPTTVTPRLRTHEKNTPEPRLTYETTLFLHKLYALNHMSEKLAHNFKFSFFGLLVMQCRSWGHCWVWHAPGGIWYCVYSAFLDRL